MDGMDLHLLATIRRWTSEGRHFALVTVARTWGSAPRAPGSWLALRDDGLVEGSVSGGCVEDDLIVRMREGWQGQSSAPFKLVYGVTDEEATRFGLPCGGTLELVVEPAPDPVRLEELALRLAERQLTRRQVDLLNGTVEISEAQRGDALCWDGARLTTVHGPQWRLLIVGAGPISRHLAQMAQMLDYEVIVCDPRQEYSLGWGVPDARLVTSMPDDALLALEPDSRLAVVTLTHDPKLDDMALLEALKSAAFYVGAIGSHRNSAKRRERLTQHLRLATEELARLHGPVGLAIGSRTPPEIALAILAEMTAIRNGVPVPTRGPSAASAAAGVPECAP